MCVLRECRYVDGTMNTRGNLLLAHGQLCATFEPLLPLSVRLGLGPSHTRLLASVGEGTEQKMDIDAI